LEFSADFSSCSAAKAEAAAAFAIFSFLSEDPFSESLVDHDGLVDLFLDDFSDFFHVGLVAHSKIEFHDRVVTTQVGDIADIAERKNMDLAPGMPQPEGPQGNLFDHPLGGTAFHIISNPNGIVDEKEYPGNDVFDQGLRAEADGKPPLPRFPPRASHGSTCA
jgi:hypothetical protein